MVDVGRRPQQGQGVGVHRPGEDLLPVPRSTIRPAYMTATSWQTWATTGRSWVTNIRLMPVSWHSRGEQPQDLVLDRHVEGGGGLVAQDQLGVAGQRHRDHDALPHPAGELVRERAVPALGLGDADPAHEIDGPLPRLGPAQAEVHAGALGDLARRPA